ncbi:MAG: diacylglycerol kinase, partial [Chitinophagaceae bacterium]|nr:diacylglycerol kinase [Chitinophagaceae bacterium]
VFKQIRGNNKLQDMVENIGSKTVLYFQVPSLIIKNLKHAPFHIDGEPKETFEEFKIEILKDCFDLVQE